MQGNGKSAGTRPDRGLARTGLEVAIYCSLLAAMIFVPSVVQAQVSRTDSLALVAIYDATGGDNWRDNTNWKSQEPVGEWYEVTVENGVVTELDLENNNLTGTLPSEIGDLTSLESLSLTLNNLTGAIPAEIGNLTKLTSLGLASNNLTGAIPSEIGDLTSLESLSLTLNNLTGAIPAEIGNLTNLTSLGLSQNSLSGAIPAEIGNLTKLTSLGLWRNSLTGAIPTEIGNLTSLELLWLSTNNLTGAIPAEIGNLTRLKELWLSTNNLTGAIPAEIGNLTNLLFLSIDSNSLSGAIPAEIGDLTSLKNLNLGDNSLSGAIPAEIGNLTRLEGLYLQDNTELTGELPAGLRLLPINYLDIRETCITTPADSDFQAWLAGIAFYDTDRVCTPPGVTVTPTALTVPEGSSAKYTVVLDAQPSANVTISLSFAAGSDADITVNTPPLTFTTGNWNTAQEVTVSAAQDDDALNGSATIEHAASGGGYGSVSVSSVVATEADNDTAGVTVTPTTLSVPEGSNAKYTVVLDTQPSADVTISLSFAAGSDADITVNTPPLTFTTGNWNTAQEVTVSAAQDDDALNGSATIEHAASGGGYGSVSVSSVVATEADNDTAGVTVTPTTLSVPEGSNAKYTVVLDTQPSADVTISLSFAAGSDADITVNTPPLTFTTGNWNTAQEVTVSAAQDDDALNGSATIEHAASGGGYGSVSVSSVVATEADNDNDADAERAALVAIYDATDGDNWTNNTNWKSQEPVGDWYGVTVRNGVVTWLKLTENALSGEIPEEIGDLTSLEQLLLSSNSLSGEIPSEIGNLTRLEDLRLRNNQLSGAIPAGIRNLTSLRVLTLHSNRLSGAIPPEIGNLTSLGTLWLWGNSLTGEIPAEIGKLTRLEQVDLGLNSLTGEIPAEIGNLTNLRRLWLHNTQLSGSIPAEIGNLTNLWQLELHNNQLSGAIPSEIENLTSLEYFRLDDNTKLTGELPAGLRLLPILELDIRNTCITTPADSDFQAWLAGITFYNTDRVCAAGVTVTTTTLSVPEGSNAKYTVVLDAQPSADVTISVSFAAGSDTDITVDKSSLTFTTDNWGTAQEMTVSAAEDDDVINGSATIAHSASGGGYGSVSVSSVVATEADNDADAERAALVAIYDATDGDNWTDNTNWKTEEPVGDWEGVTVENGVVTGLYLHSNNLRGELPSEIGNLTSLQRLNIGNNSLSGAIPSEIGDLTSLEVLWLTLNNLTGAIPSEIGNLTSLDRLWLSTNSLTGAIPSEIGNLTRLKELTLGSNSLSGAIPAEIGNLTSLMSLGLAFNSLSGAIPAEIGNLTSLQWLNLGHNQLTGAIPAEIGNLTSLEALNLNNNSLSGAIPAEIGNLTSLEQLWLDNNSLSGTIPAEIRNLTSLEELNLDNNSLSGAIPAEIGNLTRLEQLSLYDNSLSGAIPAEIGNLTSLQWLSLRRNSLTGAIPAEIGNLTSLEALSLDNNALSGEIPEEIANLTSLEWLDLSYNTELTGELSAGLRLLPVTTLDIRNTCITTPADSDFQAWLAGITFYDTDRVCAAGVTVTPTALSVPEGSNARYAVVLDTQPSEDVTISLSFASGSDEDITVDKTSLTFTTENWDTAQEITVSAAEDDDALNGAATIEHTASGGGYAGVTVSSVTATEADNDKDAVGVTVTPTALSVPEGSNAKYTVVLNAQPSADVTISLSFASGSDEDITVDKTSLAFTPDNWNAAQEVTVSAEEDTDTANGTATIDHMVSGGGYGGVTVSSVAATEADNDAAGVTVTPTALTVPEGFNAKYTVALDAQPSADVTIAVSFAAGSDKDITVDKTSLTFTPENWDAAQEITVSAAEDDDATDGTATIAHTASGGGYGGVTVSSVTATEADNDTAGVTVTPTALSVPEGSNVKYTVALDTQPSEDVTISVSLASGSDEDITVDKTSLTFTTENWDAAQEITVSAAEDDDALNGVATIEHAASGGGYGGVSVSSITATELDNDTASVTVTPTTLTVPEGGSATYTVVLDTQPSEEVTISLSFSSGSDEDITVDKTSLTFTPENWDAAQEVTVSAAVDNDIEDDAAVLNHNASGGDYGGVTVADVVVTVTDVIGGVDVSAWLARYSRVGADHLLSSVENRMESIDRGASGAEASVAGQRIVFGDSPAQPGRAFSGASAIWSVSQDYTTSSLGGDRSVRSGNSYGISSGLNAAASRYRNLTLRDALSRSAFRYAREMPSGNSFGVWGQGSFSRFSGSEAGADMDGDVMSGTVGIDNRFSGWLHGIAVSRSESEGAYRIAGEDSLSLSASLTGVYPYARYNLTDRLRVWGTGGYGSGSLRLQGDSLASSTSDLSMMLGSVGISGDIVSAASSGGFGLSWQTDAMLLRSSLASSDALSAVSAMVHRLRLSLESSYILRMGNRASLAPKVQLGVRQDGGDAEQGMGMDVAGGLGFIHSGWGLRAQVDMHGLVVHEDSDFEQWGVSGMILFDRSPSSELGMSLRLSPSWGSASSSMGGMRALWSRETVSGLAGFRRTGGDDRSLRLDSRFDYGFTAFGEHGVASPYASVSVSGSEAASHLTGADVEVGGGLGYSNRSLGLRMRAGMRGLMSEEEVGFDGWGASGVIFFDPDPSSPLGASFNVSQSWGITPRTGFGGSQTMGMREREPLPRSVTGISRSNLYGQPMRIEGEMGYGFSASGGAGVMTPYAGVAFSEQGRSGVLLGLNLQAGRRFLLNVEGSTPKVRAISFDSMPEFRVRGLLKW